MPPEKVILHIFNYFIKQVIKEAGLKSASIFLGIGGSSREMEDKSSAKVTFYVDVREGADKAMIGAQNKDTYLEHDVSVSIMQNTDKYRSQKWLTEDDSLLDIIERIRFKLQAINHIPKDDVVVYSIKHTDREYDIADAQNIIGTSTYEVKSRYTPTAAPAVIQLDKITTRIRGPHTNVPTEPSLEPLDPTQFTVDFVPGGKKFTIVNVDAYLVREDEDIEIKLSNNRYVGDSVRVEFRPNTEGTISYTNSETAVISIEAHPTEENILLINFLDDGISEVEFIFTPDDAEYVTDTYSVTITSCPAFSVVLADNSPVPDSVEVGNTLNLKAIAKLGTLITFESTDETLLTLTKGSVQNINGMAIHNFTAEALAEGAVSLSFTQAAVSGTDAGTTLTFALSVASATLIPQSITLDLRDASNAAVDLTTFSGRIDDVYTGTLSSTYVDSNGDTVSTGLMNYTLSSSDDSLATITPASTTDGTFTITFLQAGDVQFNLLQPGDTTYNTRTLVQTATIMKRAQTVPRTLLGR